MSEPKVNETKPSETKPRKLVGRSLRNMIIFISIVIIVIVSGVVIYFVSFPILPTKYVRITYNTGRLSQIGSQTPRTGFIYLVLNMTIYNHGYVEFDFYPLYLGLQIDERAYQYDTVTFDLNKTEYSTFDLGFLSTSVPVLNEQTLTGAVAFEVPSNYDQNIPIYPYPNYLQTLTENYAIIWVKS